MFLSLFDTNTEYKKLFNSDKNKINITGLTDAAKPHFLYGLFSKKDKNLLVVVNSETHAKKLSEQLSFFDVDSYILRERDFNFYNIDAGSNEIFLSRINTLKAATEKKGIYIATLDALTQPILSKQRLEESIIHFEYGGITDEADLMRKLTEAGYKRCDMVEFPGQFSKRGGIIDIFSPHSENPLRIELFGDEVDSIRYFNPHTQLSLENLSSADILCASEIILNKEEKESLLSEMRTLRKKASESLSLLIKEDMERLENEGVFFGIDKYTGYILTSSFLDYFNPEDTITVIDEPQRISEKKNLTDNDRGEAITSLLEKELISSDFKNIYLSTDEILKKATSQTCFALTGILTGTELFRPEAIFNITVGETLSYYGKINLFISDIINYKNKGYKVILPVPASKLSNFNNYLNNSGVGTIVCKEGFIPEIPGVYIIAKNGYSGFVYPDDKFVLMYDPSIFGEQKKTSKKKKSESSLTFADLQIGDYVVHDTHGIGRYVGTERLVVDNIKREFVKIKYQGTDNLYLPANQLGSLSKYIGAGERQIKLNKLGGQEFSKVKQRVRLACADLADKLIALYAEREKTVGVAFSPDTDMQISFEQAFPYTETDDQLKCISEVKHDMESTRPMDRLICGDVGYGKTEIAIRAAFKCACEGKQTAYLAATTVLAQQHYNTFKSRMENYPVTVEMLSRFRTKREQEEIVKRVNKGSVDIVIGTHRILSKDLEFKDLGLLIVDEEQRFGVEHKERLKDIKKNVEVLTLTATPIPRTLHMSMLGIRDMSVLKEPPSDRFPVQTYVLEYKEAIIYDAIERELSRNGQIFYLYNKVDSISKVADRLQKQFPDAVVSVVHGQMSETAIERRFLGMLNGEIDILVCTTIIETGIDISNANTIIVENSDALGLSQLYQLRGRVGRSNRLAYCYFTYVKGKVLTEQSESRLKAIKEFTEFGSGFKIALRDLEIRGAGNILGAQQHGHMDAVGYDMYMRILDSAIKEKKGEKEPDESLSCRVDIKADAYIPETYIGSHDVRMLIYKKIASIKTVEDAEDIKEELTDRFSDPPLAALSLIEIALIKALAEDVFINDITHNADTVTFIYANNEKLIFEKISAVSDKFRGQILINAGNKPGFTYKIPKSKSKELLDNIKEILQMLK